MNIEKNMLSVYSGIVIIVLVFVLSGSVVIVMGSVLDNFDRFGEKGVNSLVEQTDKQIYLCMELEALGGLNDDTEEIDQDTKGECNELLDNTDYFKKKELIKKYGDID